jgi:4-amino-4-deoxychorismate lyase
MNKNTCTSLINGIAADYLNIKDRAIHYGDGLFETILYEDNKLYYWQQHFHRLRVSAQRLKIACPDEDLLLEDIKQLVAANTHTHACVIKIIVSRGTGERGYQFGRDIKANRLVLLSGIEAGHSSVLSKTLLAGELFICEQQASINENLAGMKHLNRLENVLARNEWDDKSGKIIDGLMLNADGHVIEGTMSNLFGVKDRQLFTPGLERSGINGIMRDVVIKQADKHYLQVSVTDLSIDDLLEMDELFITNSLIAMKRVTKLGNTVYKDQPVAELLFKKLLNSKEDYAQAV